MLPAPGTSIAAGTTSRSVVERRSRWLFVLVWLIGLALDVISKTIAVHRLDPTEPVRLVGGWLTLRLIRNPGAAFSLGESLTPVFAVLSVAVLVFVLARLAPRIGHVGWAIALGLLGAGVSGNLADRLFRQPGFLHGHVVDFLQLPHWPIFNVADACITGAAVLIMVLAVVRNVAITGERYVKPARPSAKSGKPARPSGQSGEPTVGADNDA